MNSLNLLYGLVFLSGASGLIYEIVWQRYLAVLLGAQARATAIVLAIFLGGMCLGYQYFGKLTKKPGKNLLRIYAMVELGLAAWAFVFLIAFRFLFPRMGTLYSVFGVNSFLSDLGISLILITPPTFLMGGTLPLLTQGLSRNLENATRVHSRLYGLNTLGAGVGCFLATFVLIAKTSLPISLLIASSVNLVVAYISYEFLAKGHSLQHSNGTFIESSASSSDISLEGYRNWSLIGISFLSGFYLLALENILVRLVGLSAGSSNYNFGLIVGIFILAIGLGSFLVGNFETISNRTLTQLCLLGSAGLYFVLQAAGSFPYFHHLIRIIFRTAPENFYFYQLGLALGLSAVLFLPLLVCGMILPVCFHLIKGQTEVLGDRVGKLYSWNALGCIAGSLGGYLILSYSNLDDFLRLCVVTSLLVVVLAIVRGRSSISRFEVLSYGFAALALTAFALVTPKFDPKLFAQAFRIQFPVAESYEGAKKFAGRLFGTNQYVFYKDGPDSSIGIAASYKEGKETSRTLYMNGKSDGNTEGDKMTMELTGTLPALLSRKLDHSCVIGFGTGVTVGAILRMPSVKAVDVVEISQTLSDHVSEFDSYNGNVSKSPKVQLHVMDAFRFLEGAGEGYDLIVSEPSTPWLSGVENLYTEEFYALAKKRLTKEGVFAQWVQAYAFNDALFRMVLNTMHREFNSIRVFQLRNYDLLLIATNEGLVPADVQRGKNRLQESRAVQASLESIGLHGYSSLLSLEKLFPETVRHAAKGAQVQHLESPRLSNGAARSFFGGEIFNIDNLARNHSSYFTDVDESLLRMQHGMGMLPASELSELYQSYCDSLRGEFGNKCKELLLYGVWNSPDKLVSLSSDPTFNTSEKKALSWMHHASMGIDSNAIEQLKVLESLYHENFSPIARLDPRSLWNRFEGCAGIDTSTALYGDCLIEKIKFAQVTEHPHKEDVLEVYKTWFRHLASTLPNYEKFKTVNAIFAGKEKSY